MRRRLKFATLLLSCAFPLLLTSSISAAQPAERTSATASPRLKLFNIPPQSLHQALEAYGAVTGNAVVYDSRLAANLRSKPVVGLFTSEVALRMMLEGADLTIVYTSPTDIMLVSAAQERAEAAAAAAAGVGQEWPGAGGLDAGLTLDTLYVDVPPGSEKRPDFTAYGQMARNELKRALARDPDTADRIYQVQIDIWVNDAGRLRHPRFVQSTGKPELNDAIRRVAESVTLKTLPPKDLQQPIRMTIIAF